MYNTMTYTKRQRRQAYWLAVMRRTVCKYWPIIAACFCLWAIMWTGNQDYLSGIR